LLFADVTGSTALGERLDPEHLHEVLEAYFNAMKTEIEAEGGAIEKYIGDAIVAAFGVPVAHEDDPSRALRAAFRMHHRLDQVNEGLHRSHGLVLEIRIGVNTGEVLATVDPEPGEPMFTGDAVNVAARFEQDAEPGQIVTSERTARAARAFRYRELGTLDLKGRSSPVRAFVVEGEAAGPSRGIPGLRAPMVGRASELALLRSAYDNGAAEGRSHLVTIYGDAGVGKSRLTTEFLDWARSRTPQPTIVQGRCLPYGEGVTYWPLAEILKARAGVLDTDSPDLALRKIHSVGDTLLTAAVTADPYRATVALAYTVGVEDPELLFGDLEPQQIRDETHAAWRSFFSALALTGPVVAVIEDIHWADPALLDLLEELAERVQGGVLFVCPSRPDLVTLRPGWGGGKRTFSSVALEPLTRDEADALVTHLLAIEELPPAIHRRILERAEGNPFFLEEILRQLIDQGDIVRSGSRWRAAETIAEVEIPDSVQGVLAARIDLLAAAEKRALQSAAVVGRVFWPSPVGLLLNGEGAILGEILASLESRELVLERLGSAISGEHEYIFKHVLTRDVAYESIPRRERAAAHATVARWIEETAGERSREFVELLAYHYSTAVREHADTSPEDLRRKAFDYLLRASADARSKLVLKKAQRTAEEAVALAAGDLERSVAFEALAESWFVEYEGDLAWRYFCEAVDARLRSAPDDDDAIAYLCARAIEMPTRWPGSMRMVPKEEEVRPYLETGLSHLPEGDSEGRIRLRSAYAAWPFAFPDYDMDDGRLLEFEHAGLEAAEEAMRLGRLDLASGALDSACASGSSRGWYGRTVTTEERRAPIVAQLSDPLEIGDAYGSMAWALHEVGRYEDSARRAAEGLVLVAGRGPNVQLHLLAWTVVAGFRLGRWDAALERFDELQAVLDERKEDPPYFAAHAFAASGLIHQARGHTVEVDRIASILMPLATAGDSARLRPWMAKLLVERDDLTTARSLLDHLPDRWRVHEGTITEARIDLVTAEEEWDEVPGLVEGAREHAAKAGLIALPFFCDRLEGRAALAAGSAQEAEASLGRAIAGFRQIGAVWERARTERSLAGALLDLARTDDALRSAMSAMEVFRGLGSIHDVRRTQETLELIDAATKR
jgi:class 3 adenylate cyclase/tetratricopeptide (TPR) repeat protein